MGLLKDAMILVLMATAVAPLAGVVELTEAASRFTVNVCVPLVAAALVTVTFWAPVVALAAMVKVAVIDVLLATVVLLTVMPVPLRLIVDPAPKLVPVRVTGTVAPWLPLLEAMEVSVGVEAGVDPHPATKATSISAAPRLQDHCLIAPYFHISDFFRLNDISFLHFSVGVISKS
jgi:hypothetical protein